MTFFAWGIQLLDNQIQGNAPWDWWRKSGGHWALSHTHPSSFPFSAFSFSEIMSEFRNTMITYYYQVHKEVLSRLYKLCLCIHWLITKDKIIVNQHKYAPTSFLYHWSESHVQWGIFMSEMTLTRTVTNLHSKGGTCKLCRYFTVMNKT